MIIGDMAARAASKTQMDWHGATFVHPLAIIALLALAVWMFCSPRRRAILPFLILICFIPSAQRLVIAGADFTLLRIMAIFGMTRVILYGELSTIRLNRIDFVFIAWTLIGSLVYVLQRGEFGAVVYVSGTSLDMLGAYFVARVLIQTVDDLRAFARSIAWVAMPVAAFFVIELATQRNLFANFGGVPEITAVRDGRLRCQGAFSHPILAGVFWAAAGALMMGGAVVRQANRSDRWIFVLGTFASVFMIGASASSTPLLGFVAGVAFWMCWFARGYVRYGFAAVPFLLLGLHLVMEAPVWHLVSRVSAVGGSTGYHRYVLIDGAIKHFHEWWLLGSVSTAHWSEHFQTWDITNQYIFEGIRGGVWRLALFSALLYLVGNSIATGLRRAERRADKFLLWGFGASLFVHCVCFIGVSYFGQIQYLWYMTLAIGASIYDRSFFEESLSMSGESSEEEVETSLAEPH